MPVNNDQKRFKNPLAGSGSRRTDQVDTNRIKQTGDLIDRALSLVIENRDAEAIKVLLIIQNMHQLGQARDELCFNLSEAIYKSLNEMHVEISELQEKHTIRYLWNKIMIFKDLVIAFTTCAAAVGISYLSFVEKLVN